MRKEFIHFDTVRDNALKLAPRIERAFGVPDVLYVSLRGGAAMGNVISEYFQMRAAGKTVFYAAVVARSYRDIGLAESAVTVDGWTYSPDRLKKDDRVLLIDDIFDTGKTVNHLAGLILAHGLKRDQLAVVVHDYKIRAYDARPLPVTPDFFCRRHDVTRPEDDFWIHYLSHELKSLTDAEIKLHYLKDDPELAAAFQALRGPRQ